MTKPTRSDNHGSTTINSIPRPGTKTFGASGYRSTNNRVAKLTEAKKEHAKLGEVWCSYGQHWIKKEDGILLPSTIGGKYRCSEHPKSGMVAMRKEFT